MFWITVIFSSFPNHLLIREINNCKEHKSSKTVLLSHVAWKVVMETLIMPRWASGIIFLDAICSIINILEKEWITHFPIVWYFDKPSSPFQSPSPCQVKGQRKQYPHTSCCNAGSCVRILGLRWKLCRSVERWMGE